MPEKIYWFQTKSTGQNFEIYLSDLSDLSHVCNCKQNMFVIFQQKSFFVPEKVSIPLTYQVTLDPCLLLAE